MPDGDHEVRADEHVQLAELDLLDVVEVARGAQHHEQRGAVALELGSLVRGDRVLDREFVQPELGGEGFQFAGIGSIEPDPRHAVRSLAQDLEGLGERVRVGLAGATAVNGGVDQTRARRLGIEVGPGIVV